MKRPFATTTALLLASLSAFSAAPENHPQTRLDEAFRTPPEESKPWCYWYWLNNDISKEGVTKDLEAMARVGIKLAMIGNITQVADGPVKMFSPEWYEISRHALKEAHRLSINLMFFNSPGWSQSGGPWIKPEQSMRRVIWNEVAASGGNFARNVRAPGVPAGQDIAVFALPRKEALSITGTVREERSLSLCRSSWIWLPSENGAVNAAAGTRWFKREIQADPAALESAGMMLTADNAFVLEVNGKRVTAGDTWQRVATVSILPYLKPGANTVSVAVTNTEPGAAGLIASIGLKEKNGAWKIIGTGKDWVAMASETDPGAPAQVLGPVGMQPWNLSVPGSGDCTLGFVHPAPFTARSLVVEGVAEAKLYAIKEGRRVLVADIHAPKGNGLTDFLPNGFKTFSFPDVTAREFELDGAVDGKVTLGAAPVVAKVIEKQMGRMHPTPSPTWDSYRFPDTAEPGDPALVARKSQLINLSDKLGADGVLTCTLPPGDWTILYFGMITTGVRNSPAPPEGTGLEVDKMSKALARYHFEGMFSKLSAMLTPEEKAAWVGITIDSYEKGAQNWTDGFAAEFEKRNGYNPLPMLPVMTGRLIESAGASDQFLWDLRRTVSDMIAENYVGGLSEVAHQHGLRLWCENYGHWGFPGEFTMYGGYSDEIGGEFWSNQALGTIECRAASSAAHVYGKPRVYSEAFTSGLNLGHHPAFIKARGEELFCEGINHFVLHVYTHQPRDGVPGKNPGFGTAFHRNTPWFNESRDWVKYLQRCHVLLEEGEPVADVAVYIGDFAPQMTGPANPVPAGYDYDFIGSDAILRKLQVVDGQFVVHDERDPKRISARWKLLALPNAGYVRPQVRKRIEELKQAGGRILEGVPVAESALLGAGITPLVKDATCPLRWKARRIASLEQASGKAPSKAPGEGMIFFLSNFKNAGPFEATLRVTGLAPEWFDPVTGQITRLARYRTVEGGTRVTIDIKDPSDSGFLVFRGKPVGPSVVAASASPAELALFNDDANQLTGECAKSGTYELTMSDGSKRSLAIGTGSLSFAIAGPWKTTSKEEHGYSVELETAFEVPAGFGAGQRVLLDLGAVSVMARVKLNGKEFDTLWRPPFTLDVTEVLKPGANRLEVLVTSTSQGKPALGKEVVLRTITRKGCQPSN